MEKLKRELAELDQLFTQRRSVQSQISTSPGLTVEGFTFPLTSEQDVERLENAVNTNALLWDQYVQLLKAKKHRSIDLVDSFPMIFAATAVEGYTWAGCQLPRFPKKAMKNYSIFNGCMLDAWKCQGLDEKALEEGIKLAIQRMRRRRTAKTVTARKKSS